MAEEWWYLDLHADYPELEMYYGGWKSAQELDLIELGDRVIENEASWMFTTIYSSFRDRLWAGVAYMFRAVLERTANHTMEEVPPGWRPDVGAWERGEILVKEAQ